MCGHISEILQPKKAPLSIINSVVMYSMKHKSHFQNKQLLLVSKVNLYDKLEPDVKSAWGNCVDSYRND